MLVFANQIILVQGPGGTLLVDMGSGNDKQRPDEPWMDHVGLATTLVNGRWVPTFPRARYLASQADRDYFSSLPVAARHPSLDDSVRPLRAAGVLDLVTPRSEIAGLHLHGSDAHTPGMLFVEIKDQNVWFVGDLFHHPQTTRPEWRSSHPALDSVIDPQYRFVVKKEERGWLFKSVEWVVKQDLSPQIEVDAQYPYPFVQSHGLTLNP